MDAKPIITGWIGTVSKNRGKIQRRFAVGAEIAGKLMPAIRNEPLLNKRELANALGRPARTIDTWVRKGIISSIKVSYKGRLFSLGQVLEDLARFEVKAIGRK